MSVAALKYPANEPTGLAAYDERRIGFPGVIASIAKRSGPVKILEVGSFIGESALAWAKALQDANRKGSIVCVDPWKPYFRQADVNSNAGILKQHVLMEAGEIRRHFDLNTDRPLDGISIIPIRAKFTDAQHFLAPRGFDVIYLDGSHYYEDIRADLDAAILLLAPGGILCGDDMEIHPTKAGVIPDEHLATDTHTFPDGQWYHAGVTKAVGEAFPHNRIKCHQGFWWIE